MIALMGWFFVVGGTLAILWIVGKVSGHQYDRQHERLPEPDHRVLRHHTVDDWIASHGRNRWSQHTAGDDTDGNHQSGTNCEDGGSHAVD